MKCWGPCIHNVVHARHVGVDATALWKPRHRLQRWVDQYELHGDIRIPDVSSLRPTLTPLEMPPEPDIELRRPTVARVISKFERATRAIRRRKQKTKKKKKK